MIAAFIALAAQAASASVSCPNDLCDAERLRPYFDKLAAARRDRRTVRVIQIGDSHTAGDQITGAWRTALQARYGSAGRGVLAPGRPYAGYLTRGITASQSPGWSVDGVFGPAWHGEGVARGVAQYSLSTRSEGASIGLVADAGELFDRFTVCALHQPGAGTLLLTAGTASETVPLGDDSGPRCTTLRADMLTGSASVAVEGGPATITSWAMENTGAGGVALSNLGTVGAQLTHLSREDDAVLGAELREYRPDLIVVAFGTNEAFSANLTPDGFEGAFRVQIARLRRFAPGVPILLLGAPDSATKRPELRGAACEVAVPTDARVEQPPSAAGGWGPAANLLTVQSLQRRLAHELGLAYWDWSAAMGGRCTAATWATLPQPLMRGDRVHFTTLGGREIAALLQRDLDAAARRVDSGDSYAGQ